MVKSMYAAVAGLRTHQAKMDVIGNNIANVNTFAFKKARAAFRDQFYATMRGSTEAGNVYGGGNPSQVGYGSSLHSVDVDFGTASGAPTGNGMDVMINGNGFFMVGAFDPAGYATMSNIYELEIAAGTDPEEIMKSLTSLYYTRVGIFNVDGQGNFVDSARNYVYGYSINPATGKPGSELYDSTAGDPLRLEVLTVPWAYFDENGRIVTDAAGKAIRVSWTIQAGPPTFYEIDTTSADPLTAGPSGKVADGTGAPAEGVYIAPMKLTNISIGDDGIIVGVYQDTEEVITIGQIVIADVPNPNALENTVNGYYKAKKNTGVITAEVPGEGSTGQLTAGRLEMANVDLAQEFTEMITTQRGFQANGRIITVTDEMLAELVNLKR